MREFVRARGSATRCAYCHGALEEGVTCGECGTVTHPACSVELRGCVTPGCSRRPSTIAASVAEGAAAPLPPRTAPPTVWSHVGMGALIGALGLALVAFVVGGSTSRRAEFVGDVALTWALAGAATGALLGAVFGAALFLADDLVKRRERAGDAAPAPVRAGMASHPLGPNTVPIWVGVGALVFGAIAVVGGDLSKSSEVLWHMARFAGGAAVGALYGAALSAAVAVVGVRTDVRSSEGWWRAATIVTAVAASTALLVDGRCSMPAVLLAVVVAATALQVPWLRFMGIPEFDTSSD